MKIQNFIFRQGQTILRKKNIPKCSQTTCNQNYNFFFWYYLWFSWNRHISWKLCPQFEQKVAFQTFMAISGQTQHDIEKNGCNFQDKVLIKWFMNFFLSFYFQVRLFLRLTDDVFLDFFVFFSTKFIKNATYKKQKNLEHSYFTNYVGMVYNYHGYESGVKITFVTGFTKGVMDPYKYQFFPKVQKFSNFFGYFQTNRE